MAITTNHACPPIPDRSHDWHAHFDWQSSDDLSCEGVGETEAAAVLDLLTNAAEVDADGSEQEAITDLAHDGWEMRNFKHFRTDVEAALIAARKGEDLGSIITRLEAALKGRDA